MTDDVPDGWEAEERRSYTPADSDRQKEYATFVHASGDLRLRVAPASLDGDDHPGYSLSATAYPGLEFSESATVRRVLRFDRCRSLAVRFMKLFSATYDGPEDFEDAFAYAADRVKGHDVGDAVVDVTAAARRAEAESLERREGEE